MRRFGHRAHAGCAAGFVLVLLGFGGTAFAGGSDTGEQHKFNAADQAVARAATLKRADLNPASGWKGGPVKPDLSPSPDCPNYPIDLSSFVLTGAAETDWTQGF